MDNRNQLYESAQAKYNAKDYAGAIVLFQLVVAENGASADLYNDMAITYYHLGQYAECIDACRKVLTTGEQDKYRCATYNAGLAYWAMGKYDDAIKNFTKAIEYTDKYNNGEYHEVYENKLKQCSREYNSAQKKAKKMATELGARGTIMKIQTLLQNDKIRNINQISQKQYA
jgi:tetratricopeptide (TPR) repeat protein